MGELLGYADALSVAAGERLTVRVSSSEPDYGVEVVRLLHADANPDGPGVREVPADVAVEAWQPGRVQVARAGSHVVVPHPPALAGLDALTVQLWVLPTRPGSGVRQTLVGNRAGERGAGFELALCESGELELVVTGDEGVASVRAARLPARRWHFVAGVVDLSRGSLTLTWGQASLTTASIIAPARERSALGGGALTMAAALDTGAPRSCFDGKLSDPALFGRALTEPELAALAAGATALEVGGEDVLAAWDFGRDFAGSHVHDRSPNGHHGRTVNLPVRAVTGPAWTGDETRFSLAPDQYAAIHFHGDDLGDAGWEPSFRLALPPDLPSGVYAARLRAGDATDEVPFVVRPGAGGTSAETLLLLPTFTYLAYANERLVWGGEIDYGTLTERSIEPHPLDEVLREHPELGRSLYDLHDDGSGVCFSSARRPILSLRPGYRMWLTGAPRHLGADLYIVDWLERKGFAHDVATDGDLHEQGTDLLSRYPVLVTGTHPEYWTRRMRAALAGYLESGGRCLYLGGNGFYWVTSVDPEAPHVIEVRRGHAASRCWESAPGECHHSTTGELGGIWRHRGMPPNELVGVGFTAQGSGLAAPGYARCPGSFDPRVAFIFEGVADDEVIGDFGLVMGGAAGDELDRLDAELGSPPGTLLLATSAGRHDDGYLLVHEEQLISILDVGGATNPKVRADMTYLETPGGGAVFSVGSINWAGSLSHAGYENNVSRITENVLRGFHAAAAQAGELCP